MVWENEYEVNNNDLDNFANAAEVAERPWQYICIRRGGREWSKTHGLDVQRGWLTMGPKASERCEETFKEKPGSLEIFVTFSPCVAYKWKLQEIWLEGLVWCRPHNEDLVLVCKPIKDPVVLSLHVVEVNGTSSLQVEAMKMNGDVVFGKEFKKETTFGMVKQRIFQEFHAKHNFTDVDCEGIKICHLGILLAKDFCRCAISKKDFAAYRADGAFKQKKRR